MLPDFITIGTFCLAAGGFAGFLVGAEVYRRRYAAFWLEHQ